MTPWEMQRRRARNRRARRAAVWRAHRCSRRCVRRVIHINRLQPALTQIALGPIERNGAKRDGALPVTARALKGSLGSLAFLRPYTTELVGWFNDFGPGSGTFDANGGIARIAVSFNAFTAAQGTGTLGSFISPDARAADFLRLAHAGNLKRCPGANERDPGDHSTPFTDGGTLDCDPTQVPVGP